MRRPPSSVALALVLAASILQSDGRLSAQQSAPAATPALTEATRLLEQAAKLPPAERAQAITLAEQALALREKELGRDHTEVADAVYTLASLIRGGGDNPRALPLLQRTVVILDKTKPDSNELATVLNTLGQTHQALGQYDAARSVFERALGIREKALGPTDPTVATSLNNLALLLYLKGDYAPAEPLYRRALAIREQKLGADSPLVAQSLNNLAQLHKDRGEYLLARPLFERALALYERVRGGEHVEVATALNNLGLMLYEIGDYEAAEPMLSRAVAIREKALGPEHQLVAQSVNNLGLLYQRRGEYVKAEPLLTRSLEIREKALGTDHPDVGRALNNLAVLYQEQGQLDRAEPLYQRAMTISEGRLGPANRLTIQAINNLAVLYLLREQFDKAEPLYRRALGLAEQSLGPQHPLVASSLASLSVFYERKGDLAKAVETQARTTEVSEKHLALLVAAGSEQQKRRYLATLGDETDITLSLHNKTAANADAARLAALTVLRRKGRVLDAMSRGVESLRAGLDPADRALLDRLSATRSRLAALVLEGPSTGKPADHEAEIARLEKEQADLEASISTRSAAFRAELRPVTLEVVQAEIPPDAVLVEIALYRPFDSKATRVVDRFSKARYVAYVMRREGPIRSMELGDAGAIDAIAKEMRAALRDPKNHEIKRLSRALDAKVFAPIRPLLGDARRILVSPDGLLNLVPFAALSGEDGRYRVEQYSFTYLTSGRDLLRLDQRAKGTGAPLVIANPHFGDSAAAATPSTERAVDLTRATFVPLPGTAGEAKALAGILPDATVLTGAEATERAVKSKRGPLLLHIATHGFFLGAETTPASAAAGTRLLVMDAARNPLTAEGNPLLRSGLAFAGANTRSGGDGEDGILLALEASGLDLHGTQLVVLSACETGVGEVRAGEGVYGLRRALVLAGAESQVMSLWQVSDAATRDLMVAYYKGLKSGVGRGDGLRAVQLEMLRGTTRSHPFYWASFIQSGDWRPLMNR